MQNYFFIVLISVCSIANAQKLKKDDKLIIANLQRHIENLTADELPSRKTGTQAESLAIKYISYRFQENGLQSKGTNGYLQTFNIDEGKQVNPSTHLVVDGLALTLFTDYFPLAFSANASLEALPSMAIQEIQMPWFWDINEITEEHKNNPQWNVYNAIEQKALDAYKKSATALFVYNSSNRKDNIEFNRNDQTKTAPIPVIYLTPDAVKKYFNDESATLDINLKTEIGAKIRNENNVIGFVDNGAATTIALGIHLDYRGMNEDKNSLQQGITGIHNITNENAGDVAALLELARMLKMSPDKQNNYLFIVFVGEEQDLSGSKYFTENPTVDLGAVSYMIHMHRLGQLNPSNSMLTVGGFGTSPAWAAVYNITGKKGVYKDALQFKFDSAVTTQGDYTFFYRKNIPVLYYFTGLPEYSHPLVDEDRKINYTGELQIIKHIYSLIMVQGKNAGKVVFQK